MKHTYLLSKLTFLFLFFIGITQNLQAQVSGKVFKDFNANGIQTTAAPDPIEPGLKDVTVNAYDVTGALNSATTSASGDYSITGGTAPYRVEFILPSSYYASKGNVSNTTVQFIAGGGTANLGVNYPAQFCDSSNPNMTTSIFTNGDPLQSGSTSGENVLVGFPYDANGVAYNGTGTPVNSLSNGSQTGSVWALTYQKESKKLFSAAFIKRHTGFGPLGVGGIYVTDMNSNTTTPFVDLTTKGINLGAVTHTGLSGDKTQPSYDETVYGQVGKAGIGGMDISDDGKYLFVINLFEKKLHKIFINNPAVVPNNGDITNYNIPNPNCSNADFRPFACKYYRGKVYVGGVCSNETAGDLIGMKATVYEFDPISTTFTEVLNYPITFQKGFTDNPYFDRWNPWSDNFSTSFDYAGDQGYRYYPQYMLSDIEFDSDETMIIGGMDRFGHQIGFQNYQPDPTHTNTSLFQGVANAQVYRAGKCGSTNQWTLENNSSVCGVGSTAGANNNKGPGGGVFYYDNTYGSNHEELCFGGLAMLAGKSEVLETALDPLDLISGGVIHLNNTTGQKGALYQIYSSGNDSGLFGKANGMGDIELLCDPQPIEIGNRVFMDTNSDGIQDPTEMGLDGVVVELWKAGAKVTDVTTTNGGEWFFTNLDAETNYEVKILGSSFPSGKSLTTSNVAANGKDLIDNDAALVGNDAVIAYKTGTAGQNNHTLDFGFKVACLLTLSANSTNVKCNAGNDGTAVVEPSGNSAPVTYLWSNAATTQSISTLVAGIYTVTVTESPTCTAVASVTVTEPAALTLVCSKTDVTTTGGSDGTAKVEASGGTSPYTYSWSNGSTSDTQASLPAATYTVTVTDTNGCTKVCSSTVSEPGCNLVASATGTNPKCNLGTDGTVTLTVTGAVGTPTYLWSSGATTKDLTAVSAGIYSVTAIDGACTAMASVTLTEPSAVTITCSKTDVTTAGGSDGTASVAASGGTSPYTYSWSNGSTSDTQASLPAATYTVTVTDANGCTKVCSSTVSEPGCNLVASATSTNPKCNLGTDGTVTLTVTGAVGTPTYLWSSGATTKDLIAVAASTYLVTVTNGSCVATATVTLSEPSAVTITCSKTDATTNGGSDGTVSVSASGGTSPYTYLWSNAATSASITGLTAATYNVTVTDANGCIKVCSSTVSEPGAAPLGSISGKFWKDTNNDGLENNGELVFSGVKVELFASDASGIPTGAALQTVTTLANGLYSFTNLPAGDYVVKIDKTTIMVGMELGTKKDVGFDDTIDNDFDAALGLSGKIVLDPTNPATKDFTNINGAIINSATPTPCPTKICSPVRVTKI